MKIVSDFLLSSDASDSNSIAVITPYSKQVQLIRNELSSRRVQNTTNNNNPRRVTVGTVDSFQGRETDIVIFSAVRSNTVKEIGFLRDARRLNVAITRARRGLILIGDEGVLKTCCHWAALLESCERRGVVMDAERLLLVPERGQQRQLLQVPSTLSGGSGDGDGETLLDRSDEFYGLFSVEKT